MGAIGVLPRSKPLSLSNGGDKKSSNFWLKSLVVAVCLLNAYYCLKSLHPSCPPVRQLLSSGEAAATAALAASSEQQLLVNELREQQQQQPVLGSCGAKVEDISSWAAAPLTDGPFHFPRIIHQTIEDKDNVSCEALACMQTWMDMNPGYEHRLVDAAERREFVATYYPEVGA
jgi:mannosyltransferase OCH1-like enzyme